MATLAVQNITRAGLGPSYTAAAAGGDSFAPDAQTWLHVKNGGASPITVTVVTPGTAIPDVAVADVAVSVPAGGERMLGPFPYPYFADAADGLADVTYSAVTSVTVAAFKLTQP